MVVKRFIVAFLCLSHIKYTIEQPAGFAAYNDDGSIDNTHKFYTTTQPNDSVTTSFIMSQLKYIIIAHVALIALIISAIVGTKQYRKKKPKGSRPIVYNDTLRSMRNGENSNDAVRASNMIGSLSNLSFSVLFKDSDKKKPININTSDLAPGTIGGYNNHEYYC